MTRYAFLALLLAGTAHAQGIDIGSPFDGQRLDRQTLTVSGTTVGGWTNPPAKVQVMYWYPGRVIGGRWVVAGTTDVFLIDYYSGWWVCEVTFYVPKGVGLADVQAFDSYGLRDDAVVMLGW